MTKTIRMLTRAAAAALLIAATGPGCGSAEPSEELTAARAAYEEAHQSEARELVPDQLLEARQALDAAEAEFDDDENSAKARTLAYIAQRKALLAMAAGETAAAKKQGVESEREYKELLEAVAKKTRQKLGRPKPRWARPRPSSTRSAASWRRARRRSPRSRSSWPRSRRPGSAARRSSARSGRRAPRPRRSWPPR